MGIENDVSVVFPNATAPNQFVERGLLTASKRLLDGSCVRDVFEPALMRQVGRLKIAAIDDPKIDMIFANERLDFIESRAVLRPHEIRAAFAKLPVISQVNGIHKFATNQNRSLRKGGDQIGLGP